MAKEDVAHIYNGILLSHKKKERKEGRKKERKRKGEKKEGRKKEGKRKEGRKKERKKEKRKKEGKEGRKERERREREREEGRKEGRKRQSIFKAMAKNFPNLGEKMNIQILEAQRTPSMVNPNRAIWKHIIMKLS